MSSSTRSRRRSASSKKRRGEGDSTEPPADPPSVPSSPELPAKIRWGHLLLCGVGGFMQCLGYAGFGLWPFALISFIPMMWVLDREPNATTKRVLALGWFHGTVGHTGGYYWLVDMLENFSGYEGVANWLFASVFFLYQGFQQMLVYWLYRRARERGVGATAAAVPALLAIELLFPVLFPSYLGHGFHEIPVAIQVADLGGVMLISAVAMAINGALYEVFMALRAKKTVPFRPPAIALAAAVFTLGYGAYRVHEVDARAAAAEHVNVGLVQVDMGIFEKREEPFEGHRRHLEQSERLLAQQDLDLLVWPESAYTFFLPDGMTNVKRRVMGPVDVPTLFGGLARRRVGDDERHYNTAFLADGDGEIVSTYDKTYLLAFGEYLPLGETFPILYDWSPNTGHFTPGDHVRPMVLGDLRISTLVCYEDVLPAFTRSAVREGNPNLLVNITNDAWFGDTQEPWIHLALAKFRAVEHHRALARSTNSGVSAFVDPVGRVLSTLDFGVRGELSAELPLLDSPTLYQWVGDWPGWASLGAILFLGFVRKGREKTAT